jgi:hypothetical protein
MEVDYAYRCAKILRSTFIIPMVVDESFFLIFIFGNQISLICQ